jgi:hypothetical protein
VLTPRDIAQLASFAHRTTFLAVNIPYLDRPESRLSLRP